MQDLVGDRRRYLGPASFLVLILGLGLCVPFTLDRAQPNQPLKSAVSALMK